MRGPFKPEIIAQLIAGERVRDGDELSEDREAWQPVQTVRALFAGLDPAATPTARGSHDAPGPAHDEHPPIPAEPSPDAAAATPARSTAGREGSGAGEPPGHRRHAVPRLAERIGRRRRGASLVGREVDPAVTRVKQASALVSVLALIVLAGIAFLPEPDLNPPDCSAPAAPGVNWSNCRLEGLTIDRASLAGAKLRNAVLPAAGLMAAELKGADLAYAELAEANLSYADISTAVAVGANLRNADLAYADLRGADLSYADLTGANLGGADLRGATLDFAIWVDARVCYEGSTGGCRLPVVPARQNSDG